MKLHEHENMGAPFSMVDGEIVIVLLRADMQLFSALLQAEPFWSLPVTFKGSFNAELPSSIGCRYDSLESYMPTARAEGPKFR